MALPPAGIRHSGLGQPTPGSMASASPSMATPSLNQPRSAVQQVHIERSHALYRQKIRISRQQRHPCDDRGCGYPDVVLAYGQTGRSQRRALPRPIFLAHPVERSGSPAFSLSGPATVLFAFRPMKTKTRAIRPRSLRRLPAKNGTYSGRTGHRSRRAPDYLLESHKGQYSYRATAPVSRALAQINASTAAANSSSVSSGGMLRRKPA